MRLVMNVLTRLSTKLLLLFLLLAIIPPAVVGYLAYDNGRRTIERMTVDHLDSTSRFTEAAFERWIASNEMLLRSLASRPLLEEAVAILASNDQADPEYRAAHDAVLREHLGPALEEGHFLELAIIRAQDGLIVVSSDESLEGKYRESEPFFVEGKARTYVGKVSYSLSEGGAVMDISTPIHDEQGDVIAVLAGHADLAEIAEIRRAATGVSSSEDAYLINTSRFFVTEPRFGEGFALKKAIHTEGAEACLERGDGMGLYDDYRGVPVLATYRWLPERELCILTELDQAEAFAPIVALRNATIAAGVVMVLIAASLGVIFTRTITGPVLQLVKATEEIGAGNLDYRIDVSGRDEIGQLGAAFNQMTRKRKQAEDRLKQTMADLERSNKELEQFAYVASHDLQEPLRMVSSYTQLLARRYQDQLDQDAHDFITYAVEGAERMQRLINDLLAYSRLATRGKPFGKTDCQRALQETLANLRTAIDETKATVTHDPLPTVFADESQLIQVFQNVVSNAIKFHGQAPPVIQIGAERKNDEWVFSVRDNGIGIDPQYHERIFVIFQRLHSGDEYPGTGIGLALCKRIVERHGGRIWVESDLGEGATFCFTIPDREVEENE
jgi:signal transduction histidine kinase